MTAFGNVLKLVLYKILIFSTCASLFRFYSFVLFLLFSFVTLNVLYLKGYTKALDIWSVGCILGEMINNKPMFPGKHYLDQICKIQEVLGSPSKEDLAFITNPKAQLYVSSLPSRPTVAWLTVYPNANERYPHYPNILIL